MSDDMPPENPFGFAFGEDASEEFKERLKEMMRAQREAMEEIQAEGGGQRQGVKPAALIGVDEVEADGLVANANLAWTGFRRRQIHQMQDLGSAGLFKSNSAHQPRAFFRNARVRSLASLASAAS